MSDHKTVTCYSTEQIEDLMVMFSQHPSWHDPTQVTLPVGRVELERLLATALAALAALEGLTRPQHATR